MNCKCHCMVERLGIIGFKDEVFFLAESIPRRKITGEEKQLQEHEF